MSQQVSELKSQTSIPGHEEFQKACDLKRQYQNPFHENYQNKNTIIQARNSYGNAAKLGHPDALREAIHLFLHGYKNDKNIEILAPNLNKAQYFFKKLTALGTEEDRLNYCLFLKNNTEFLVEENFVAAVNAIKTVENNFYVSVFLAETYEFGILDKNNKRIWEQNSKECVRFYQKAMLQEPLITYEGFYSTGYARYLLYFAKDLNSKRKGLNMLERGADVLNNRHAACELAIYIEAEKDYSLAAQYYKKAIRLKDHDAPLFLAEMIAAGYWKDDEKEKTARYYYEMAYDRGNLVAKEKLLKLDPQNIRFKEQISADKPETKTEILDKEKLAEPTLTSVSAKENIAPTVSNTAAEYSPTQSSNKPKKSPNMSPTMSSFSKVNRKLAQANKKRNKRKEKHIELELPPPPKTIKEKPQAQSIFSYEAMDNEQLRERKNSYKSPQIKELFDYMAKLNSEQEQITQEPDVSIKIVDKKELGNLNDSLEIAQLEEHMIEYRVERNPVLKQLKAVALMDTIAVLVLRENSLAAVKLQSFLIECSRLNPQFFEFLLTRHLSILQKTKDQGRLLTFVSFIACWPSEVKISILTKLLNLGFEFAHPIHQYAALGQRDKILEEIKKDRAMSVDSSGATALNFACAYNQVAILEELTKHIPKNRKDKQGENLLFTAFRTGNLEACKELLRLEINTHDFINSPSCPYRLANYLGEKRLIEWLELTFGKKTFVPEMFKAKHEAVKKWEKKEDETVFMQALQKVGQFKPVVAGELDKTEASASLSK